MSSDNNSMNTWLIWRWRTMASLWDSKSLFGLGCNRRLNYCKYDVQHREVMIQMYLPYENPPRSPVIKSLVHIQILSYDLSFHLALTSFPTAIRYHNRQSQCATKCEWFGSIGPLNCITWVLYPSYSSGPQYCGLFLRQVSKLRCSGQTDKPHRGRGNLSSE